MKKDNPDILVIGAGPAGTVAASIVHKAGYSVEIVEKLTFPRFVIGESLLPRCMEAFEEAGLIDAIKQAGFQEKWGAKFVKGKKICDFNFSEQYTKGWGWTWQVQRADFDKLLADEVQKKGIPLSYRTEVIGADMSGDTPVVTIKTAEGTQRTIEPKFVIDASGYGRVLPGLLGLDGKSTQATRIAHFVHLKDVKRENYDEPNRIIIISHAPGVWAWVIPFSTGITSVGFVGYPEFFDGFPDDPTEKMRAIIAGEGHIAERMKDSEYLWEPRILKGWSSSSTTFFGKNYALVGNVTEFLDPIFSSGVTLGVSSSQIAANLAIKTLRGEEVNWEKEYTQKMMVGIDTFRSYVNGWYEGTLDTIFYHDNQREEIKAKICSVLAGYVWDETNPFVRNSETTLKNLANAISAMK